MAARPSKNKEIICSRIIFQTLYSSTIWKIMSNVTPGPIQTLSHRYCWNKWFLSCLTTTTLLQLSHLSTACLCQALSISAFDFRRGRPTAHGLLGTASNRHRSSPHAQRTTLYISHRVVQNGIPWSTGDRTQESWRVFWSNDPVSRNFRYPSVNLEA